MSVIMMGMMHEWVHIQTYACSHQLMWCVSNHTHPCTYTSMYVPAWIAGQSQAPVEPWSTTQRPCCTSQHPQMRVPVLEPLAHSAVAVQGPALDAGGPHGNLVGPLRACMVCVCVWLVCARSHTSQYEPIQVNTSQYMPHSKHIQPL